MAPRPEGQPKEKRRNSDRRKEKSRDAARCRRSKECDFFTDLSEALPLPSSLKAQLDKASVMRLAISYLRVRSFLDDSAIKDLSSVADDMDPLYPKALEGFVIILSMDGDIVYLSDSVCQCLGLTQVDITGQSIYDYSHPCDHQEIRNAFSEKRDHTVPHSMFIRMKCTLTSKGRSVNLKSAGYKVIHFTGRMISPNIEKRSHSGRNHSGSESDEGSASTDSSWASVRSDVTTPCFLAIGEPIPHPSNIEIPLDKQTFLSKHSLDMKYTYVDDKIGEFLGYNQEDLLGHSLYEICHVFDCKSIEESYKTLFVKGQCQTGLYRFMAKNGGHVWVQTQATLIYGGKSQQPQSVVCVNFVVSGIEQGHEILSCSQLGTDYNAVVKQELVEPSAEIPEEEIKELEATIPTTVQPTTVQPTILTTVQPTTVQPTIPTTVQPTTVQPTAVQPTAVQPTTVQPTTVQPTTVQPTIEVVPPERKTLAPLLLPDFLGSLKPDTIPKASTDKILVPRTEDMNKGFLSFTNDEVGATELKDEVEDLTHLAPTAGDACVPLDIPFDICFEDEEFDFPYDLEIGAPSEISSTSEKLEPIASPKQLSPVQVGNSPLDKLDITSAPLISEIKDQELQIPLSPLVPSRSPSPSSDGEDQMDELLASPSVFKEMDIKMSPLLDQSDLESEEGLGFSEADLVKMSEGDLCSIGLDQDDFPLISGGDMMWGSPWEMPTTTEQKRSEVASPPPRAPAGSPEAEAPSLAQLLLRKEVPPTMKTLPNEGNGGKGAVTSHVARGTTHFTNSARRKGVNEPPWEGKRGKGSTICVKRSSPPSNWTVSPKRICGNRSPSEDLVPMVHLTLDDPKGLETSVGKVPENMGSGSIESESMESESMESEVGNLEPGYYSLPPPPAPQYDPTVPCVTRALLAGSLDINNAIGQQKDNKVWAEKMLAEDLPPTNSSVLLNLLGCPPLLVMKNPDALEPPDTARMECPKKQKLDPYCVSLSSLLRLSAQDCEVNAPVTATNNLLQGQDLLIALEVADAIVE